MTERERLIELINKARDEYPTVPLVNGCKPTFTEFLTEQLLSSGVIVSPVKVGQTVWFPSEYHDRPYPITITYIEVFGEGMLIHSFDGGEWYGEDIGEILFLTQEEAEIELERRKNEREITDKR